MNDCQHAIRLTAYHDDELSPEARAELELHLRQCPPCQAELKRIREISRMLGSAAGPEISPAAMARLHRAIDLEPAAGIRRMAEALAAAAATILVACVIGLARQSPARGAPAEMPVWETSAVARQGAEPASGGSEELLARWTVQDLSGSDGRD